MLAAANIDLYYGASRALSAVTLNAAMGQVTCVLGRNGVGKTSLLRAIAGLQPVKSGSIMFDGRDITLLSTPERARAVAG